MIFFFLSVKQNKDRNDLMNQYRLDDLLESSSVRMT